jgi:hypothetical protein
MSHALSRRLGTVIDVRPILGLDPVQKLEMARAVERAQDFADLPAAYQQLILEAESNRERLIAAASEPAAKAGVESEAAAREVV